MMQKKYQDRHLRKVISNLARNDPKTKEVVLNGFSIGDDHEKMARLAMSIVGNTHIQILCLNKCSITSKGAHLLAYAMTRNRSLDHVWLNDNKIGSSGAEAIATALTKNQHILTVGLSHNSIGNHGGRALAAGLQQNSAITDVFVEGNRMSHRVEDEINRVCYGFSEEEEDDSSDCDDYVQQEYLYCDQYYDSSRSSFIVPQDQDDITEAGTVISNFSVSMVAKTLGAIKEVDYESDSDDDESSCQDDNDGDSTTASVMSDELDFDFTCFYTKTKETKMSKLKSITRRLRGKKVKPDH